mgnify:FL=1
MLMTKYKVGEVAKDFGMAAKDVIEILKQFDETTPYKTTTVLGEADLNFLFDYITGKNQVKSFDDYFASGKAAQQKREEEKKKAKEAMLAEQAALAAQLKAAAAGQDAPESKEKAQQTAAAAKAPEKPMEKAAEKPAEPAKTAPKPAEKPAEQKESEAKAPEKAPAPAQPVAEKPAVTPAAHKKPKKQPAQSRKESPVREKQLRRGDTVNVNKTVDTYRIDTRATNVELDKYNEKYDTIAPANRYGDNVQRKQKIHQKSQQYRRGGKSNKRETEADKLRKIQLERIKAKPIEITVGDEITVAELASRMKKTAAEVVKKLMMLGIMASATEVIDFDTAAIVAEEMGAIIHREVAVSYTHLTLPTNSRV